MQNPSEKMEAAPPSYTSCLSDNAAASSSTSSTLDEFIRIVGNHERLHFHAPTGMNWCTVPEVVQIRDSTGNPIFCVMMGRMIAGSGRNRIVSSREIMTPSGETLVSISPGSTQTLSSGDQILGMLEDGKLLCKQTLKAKNVIGDLIFEGAGDHNIGDTGCNCCIECGFGYCISDSTEFIFTHHGVTLAQLTKSTNNSSGNELVLFNSADMDPRTKAILLYASYSAFLMFFVDTKFGRIGDRGAGKRICLLLIVGTVLLMVLPLLHLL